jgi:hypothetical protein
METFGFEMPKMDEHLGKCGLSNGNGPCRGDGVVRMPVEVTYSDEDRYYTGPYFVPYVSDEVMVVLCEDHKLNVKSEFDNALRIVRDRIEARDAAQAEVDALEAQLQAARDKLNGL